MVTLKVIIRNHLLTAIDAKAHECCSKVIHFLASFYANAYFLEMLLYIQYNGAHRFVFNRNAVDLQHER